MGGSGSKFDPDYLIPFYGWFKELGGAEFFKQIGEDLDKLTAIFQAGGMSLQQLIDALILPLKSYGDIMSWVYNHIEWFALGGTAFASIFALSILIRAVKSGPTRVIAVGASGAQEALNLF